VKVQDIKKVLTCFE